MRSQQTDLEARLAKLARYRDYLESIVQPSDGEYLEIDDLLNRHKTLEEANAVRARVRLPAAMFLWCFLVFVKPSCRAVVSVLACTCALASTNLLFESAFLFEGQEGCCGRFPQTPISSCLRLLGPPFHFALQDLHEQAVANKRAIETLHQEIASLRREKMNESLMLSSESQQCVKRIEELSAEAAGVC